MRSLPTILMMLLLVSSMISGCVSEPTKVDSEEDIPVEENQDHEPPNFSEHCIEYEELERCWLLVPPILNKTVPSPLLIDLHGNDEDMYQQRWTSDFANISIEQGFIVAYPQGHNKAWNQGSTLIPCSDFLRCSEEDDVGFILQMLETIIRNHSIDQSRIYSTGWSNGCGMTQRLAVQASEIFISGGAWQCTKWQKFLWQTIRPSIYGSPWTTGRNRSLCHNSTYSTRVRARKRRNRT